MLKNTIFNVEILEVTDDDPETECDSCYGSGRVDCDYCDGDGEIVCNTCYGDGEEEEGVTCSECDGEAKVSCDSCDGSGADECSQCDGDGRPGQLWQRGRSPDGRRHCRVGALPYGVAVPLSHGDPRVHCPAHGGWTRPSGANTGHNTLNTVYIHIYFVMIWKNINLYF